MKIKKAIIAVFCTACSMVLCSCGSQANDLFKYIDDNDFSGALEYFEDEIKDNKDSDFKKEFKKGMEERYDDIIKKVKKSKIDDDELEDLFELLESAKIKGSKLEDFIDDVKEAAGSIENSFSDLKENSIKGRVVTSKIKTANDIAAKMAEQSTIIACEMEVEGAPGFYNETISITADEDTNNREYARKLVEELQKNMPETFPCEAVIVFGDNGNVSCVVYHDIEEDYVGAYPTGVTFDEIKEGRTYSEIMADRTIN